MVAFFLLTTFLFIVFTVSVMSLLDGSQQELYRIGATLLILSAFLTVATDGLLTPALVGTLLGAGWVIHEDHIAKGGD